MASKNENGLKSYCSTVHVGLVEIIELIMVRLRKELPFRDILLLLLFIKYSVFGTYFHILKRMGILLAASQIHSTHMVI